MSYIFNNKIEYSDSPNLDAFGRLRTSNVTSLLEYKHTYSKLPLVIDEATGGTVSSVFDKMNAQVVMTTSAINSYVIRQGRAWATYQPGKSQLIEATFSNFKLETDIIKRVGYFTSDISAPYDTVLDGMFLESNGITSGITFQIWQSGVTIYSSDTTSWLTDDFDPINIDWSKGQLMMIDFQWLGIGRVRFYMLIDGTPRLFTTFTASNNINHVYMRTPNQPIRYEIRQSGTTSGSFDMMCSQVSMEGALNNLQRSTSINGFSEQTVSPSTKHALIGYRMSEYDNGIIINLTNFNVLNSTGTNKKDYLITVELNPVLSSTPTFTSITDSPISYSISGGTVSSTGFILASYVGSSSELSSAPFEYKDNILRPGVNINGSLNSIWICVTLDSGGSNQKFRSTANLTYYQ